MQDKLFNALNLRTKMLYMITHDLKSPITRLKLRQELGLIDHEKDIKDIEILESLANQIILDIRDNIFEYEELERFDLLAMLRDFNDMYSNLEILSNLDSIYIQARRKSLIRAFDNLINNAKKYSNKVLIQISSNNKNIKVSIKDYGPGINPKELKNIFKPFYKPSNSNSGHGLGLAISQEIFLNHRGSIEIRNHNKPHGIIVNVILPL